MSPFRLVTLREWMWNGRAPSETTEGPLEPIRPTELRTRKTRSPQRTVKRELKVTRKNLRNKFHTNRWTIKTRRNTSSVHSLRRSFDRISENYQIWNVISYLKYVHLTKQVMIRTYTIDGVPNLVSYTSYSLIISLITYVVYTSLWESHTLTMIQCVW